MQQLVMDKVETGSQFGVVSDDVRKTVEFTTKDTFLVWEENAQRACYFEIVRDPMGRAVLAGHRGDVSVATHSSINVGDRCKTRESYTGQSPHSKVAALVVNALRERLIPRVELPALPENPAPSERHSIKSPPTGGWQCPHCGAQNPGDPCFNCDRRADEE